MNVAQEVFKELRIKEVDLISLAKERAVEGSRLSRFEQDRGKDLPPSVQRALHSGEAFARFSIFSTESVMKPIDLPSLTTRR